MNAAKDLAQQLFDEMVAPLIGLPLTDDAIRAMGIELAYKVLGEIVSRNTDESKHDFYCDVHGYISEVVF